jgi:hypothetical protein
MPVFTLFADDGEYSETAGSIAEACGQLTARRPGLYIAAAYDNAMRRRLVIEEVPVRCMYREVPGDPAIVICRAHDPDAGLFGDEWCPKDPDGAIRGAGSI